MFLLVIRSGSGNDECSRVCLSILTIIVLIAVPTFVYMAESKKYEMGRAFFEATEIIEELPNDQTIYPSLENKLVSVM